MALLQPSPRDCRDTFSLVDVPPTESTNLQALNKIQSRDGPSKANLVTTSHKLRVSYPSFLNKRRSALQVEADAIEPQPSQDHVMTTGGGVHIPARHYNFKNKIKIPVCVGGQVIWLTPYQYKKYKAKRKAEIKSKAV